VVTGLRMSKYIYDKRMPCSISIPSCSLRGRTFSAAMARRVLTQAPGGGLSHEARVKLFDMDAQEPFA
jgi:hypothetical protein